MEDNGQLKEQKKIINTKSFISGIIFLLLATIYIISIFLITPSNYNSTTGYIFVLGVAMIGAIVMIAWALLSFVLAFRGELERRCPTHCSYCSEKILSSNAKVCPHCQKKIKRPLILFRE